MHGGAGPAQPASQAALSAPLLHPPAWARCCCCCPQDYKKVKLAKRIENLKSKDMFVQRTPKAKPVAAAAGKPTKKSK